jgi:hypothetical protein
MDLGKFNPNNFETHESAFINLLAQTYGVQGKNLKYITDKKSVYRLLKHFLVNTSGWTWFEPYDTKENWHGAFLAWTSHYNGQVILYIG